MLPIAVFGIDASSFAVAPLQIKRPLGMFIFGRWL